MMSRLTNHEVAEIFSAIADLMEILDEDRFRVQAYRRASDAIRDLPAPLATYRDRGELVGYTVGLVSALASLVVAALIARRLSTSEQDNGWAGGIAAVLGCVSIWGHWVQRGCW